MALPRVYIETSVISYLTARPSRDLIVAAHQQLTLEWWEARAADFERVLSLFVLDELAQGDPLAAARRLHWAQGMAQLPIAQEALSLATDPSGLLGARL